MSGDEFQRRLKFRMRPTLMRGVDWSPAAHARAAVEYLRRRYDRPGPTATATRRPRATST